MADAFKTHPQPRTFAPSKEDVLQNLQYFFGAPVSPEKLKDYSEPPRHDLSFPGRVCGIQRAHGSQIATPHSLNAQTLAHRARAVHRQTKIRDTLNNLILKSPQNWQTASPSPSSTSRAPRSSGTSSASTCA